MVNRETPDVVCKIVSSITVSTSFSVGFAQQVPLRDSSLLGGDGSTDRAGPGSTTRTTVMTRVSHSRRTWQHRGVPSAKSTCRTGVKVYPSAPSFSYRSRLILLTLTSSYFSLTPTVSHLSAVSRNQFRLLWSHRCYFCWLTFSLCALDVSVFCYFVLLLL